MGTMVGDEGWPRLFWAAFRQSGNPMVLLDDVRLIADANDAFLSLVGYARDEVIGQPGYRFVLGGPVLSAQEWTAGVAVGHFTGETELLCANGDTVMVQWGADTELVTGRRLVLLVGLSTSRWGRHFRRSMPSERWAAELSDREREVVGLVAEGRTGPEIAEELHIANDTARTHVRNAMAKTASRSRAQLVAKALAAGLIS